MSIVARLSELSGKRKEIEAAAREQAKAILAPGLKEFMTGHPDVKAIGWTQYTPYFNDGDPCEFSVHDMHVSVSDERGDSLYDEGWQEVYGHRVGEGFKPETWKDLVDLSKALQGAEPELLAAFGDHVQVIVTPAGIDIEEHEHD